MDDIQFGQLEESEPQLGIRPDFDKHFVVAECGQLASADFPIFVDLDVMRDMEAHARTNTSVELGGVMLGHQYIDKDGNPFVLVTDSLRARHYEATKGSFKFTHETWSQITRERKEFKNDLEMIGWYHTHPGWSVFLSGMDMFICNNFFNRDLDVALVIDPCADDRGWFQWNEEEPRDTRPTGGFLIMTNRYRSAELNYFKNLYDKTPSDSTDPRYVSSGFSEAGANSSPHSIYANEELDMDSRRPLYDMAFISMMFLQLLMASLIVWKLVIPAAAPDETLLEQQIAELQTRQTQQDNAAQSSFREEAYRDILDRVVSRESGQAGLARELVDLRDERRLLTENLEGQFARVKQSNGQRAILARELRAASERNDELTASVEQIGKDYDELKSNFDKAFGEKKSKDPNSLAESTYWWWIPYLIGGLGVLTVGAIGFFVGEHRARQLGLYDYDSETNDHPENSTSEDRQSNFGEGNADAVAEKSDAASASGDSAPMTFND